MQPELRPVVGDVVVTDGTVPRGPIPAPPLGVPESTAVPAVMTVMVVRLGLCRTDQRAGEQRYQ